MRGYWRHAALAIQATIAYRVGYVINVVSSAVVYLVVFFVWLAVYSGNSVVAGYSWQDMKGYLVVALFTGAMISGFSEFRIARIIRTGDVAVEILRPVDFQTSNLAVTLGNSLTEGLLVGIILLGFVLCIGAASYPNSLEAWVGFLAALILSYLTKYLVLYLFSLVCFWTTSFMGINWLRRGLSDFFSGAIIPLSFFPDSLRTLADLLPFRSIVYLPAAIYVGKLSGLAMLKELGAALVWVVVLWFAGKGLWALAMRKVTIHGG